MFLLYYSVYGLLLVLSSNCPPGLKSKALASIAVSFFLGIGLLVGVGWLSRAWQSVEQEFESAPMYSVDKFAHAEESRYWAVKTMASATAAAVLFPVVFGWMRFKTLAPLEAQCTKQQGTFVAKLRDALKSLEFLVFGVGLLLVLSLWSSIRNWRAFRAIDKESEAAERTEAHSQALQSAREARAERFGGNEKYRGRSQSGSFGNDDGPLEDGTDADESNWDTVSNAFKRKAPLTAASAGLAWEGLKGTGRVLGRAKDAASSSVKRFAGGVHQELPHSMPAPQATPHSAVPSFAGVTAAKPSVPPTAAQEPPHFGPAQSRPPTRQTTSSSSAGGRSSYTTRQVTRSRSTVSPRAKRGVSPKRTTGNRRTASPRGPSPARSKSR